MCVWTLSGLHVNTTSAKANEAQSMDDSPCHHPTVLYVITASHHFNIFFKSDDIQVYHSWPSTSQFWYKYTWSTLPKANPGIHVSLGGGGDIENDGKQVNGSPKPRPTWCWGGNKSVS
jgi:hypothetical protein